MLRCSDGSLYTGITTDLDRRINEHNTSKRGAKYTRSRRPVQYAWVWETDSRSLASKEEARIKRLSKTEKESLIKKPIPVKAMSLPPIEVRMIVAGIEPIKKENDRLE